MPVLARAAEATRRPLHGRVHHGLTVQLALVFVQAVLLSSVLTATKKQRDSSTRWKWVATFTEIEACPDKKQYGKNLNWTSEVTEDGDVLNRISMNLTAPAKSFSLLRVIIQRCRENVNNACEYFTTWNWDVGVCQLLLVDHVPWAPLVQSITPKFACPVHSGVYTATNPTIDLDTMIKINRNWRIASFSHLRAEYQMYDELHALYMCVKFVVKMSRVKRRMD